MYKVFIDPGHGAKDTGAAGYGVVEKNINLTVSLILRELLVKDGRFEVELSREMDSLIDINARCNLANSWKADILISKHHNSAAAKSAKGAEVLCSVNGGDSLRLGKLLIAEYEKIQVLRKSPIVQKRGNRGDYYGMIRQSKAPAVITEFCFLSNEEDAAKVNTYEKLKKQAEADYKAILKYFGLQEIKKEEEEIRYKYLEDIPEGEYQNVIEELINKGLLKGYSGEKEQTEVDLSVDMVRMLVINYRAGIYSK